MSRLVLVPHMGLGDMLVLGGMVRALSTRYDQVVVVCLRKYRDSLSAMFEDLGRKVVLGLVESAASVSPRFGADPVILRNLATQYDAPTTPGGGAWALATGGPGRCPCRPAWTPT